MRAWFLAESMPPTVSTSPLPSVTAVAYQRPKAMSAAADSESSVGSNSVASTMPLFLAPPKRASPPGIRTFPLEASTTEALQNTSTPRVLSRVRCDGADVPAAGSQTS